METQKFNIRVCVNSLLVTVEGRTLVNPLADAIDAAEGFQVTETRIFRHLDQGVIGVWADGDPIDARPGLEAIVARFFEDERELWERRSG